MDRVGEIEPVLGRTNRLTKTGPGTLFRTNANALTSPSNYGATNVQRRFYRATEP
jgi:hypothetical protein